MLPPFLARPILSLSERRGWLGRVYFGMEIKATSITGYLRFLMLAKLRRLRPYGYRFKQEQAQIESWLGLIAEAARHSGALALEVAECARLIKGYGDTHARGLANYRSIEARVIRPALAGAHPAATRRRRAGQRAHRRFGRSGGREPRQMPGRDRRPNGVPRGGRSKSAHRCQPLPRRVKHRKTNNRAGINAGAIWGEAHGRHTDRATARDRRRGLPARARRPRRRLFLLQSRHRLSADRGSLRPRQEDQCQGAQADPGAAREPRGRHGARRLLDDRPPAGGDGAHHGRHRQYHQQSHQRLARPRAADPRRRTHADHREGLVRVAHSSDPMGPGNVRPGRHGARTGEMGLRIAHAGPGRRCGRARASKWRWRIRAGRSI